MLSPIEERSLHLPNVTDKGLDCTDLKATPWSSPFFVKATMLPAKLLASCSGCSATTSRFFNLHTSCVCQNFQHMHRARQCFACVAL